MSIHNHQVIKDQEGTEVGRIELLFGNAGVKIVESSTHEVVRMTKKQALKAAELINKKYKKESIIQKPIRGRLKR